MTTKPLSKLCEACGEPFYRPEKGGMAKWMRRSTCGRPECVQALQRRYIQRGRR